MGLRVRQKVERIVHEEMQAAGAQHVHFPALLPKEPYEATGRWDEYGDGIFRLKDHTDRLFDSAHILGMPMPFDKATLNQAQKDVVRAGIRRRPIQNVHRLSVHAVDLHRLAAQQINVLR